MTNPKNALPFDHDLMRWDEIEKAEAEGLGVGKNADAGKLLRFLILNSGFDKLTGLKSIAHALYEDAEPEIQNPLRTLKEPGRRTRGMNRLENLLRGHVNFVPREAEVFHKALRASACAAWADLVTPEELVALTPAALSTKAIATGLAWPDAELPPALAMEALTLMLADEALIIAPAFTESDRLGLTPGSANADLMPIDLPPSYPVGAGYHLHVAGLKPGAEQLLLVEISTDALSVPGGNASYQGFPIARRLPENTRLTQKANGKEAYRIGEAPGMFAFFAIGLPADWDSAKMLEADMEEERWTIQETSAVAKALRAVALRHPGQIRMARHAYRVAG